MKQSFFKIWGNLGIAIGFLYMLLLKRSISCCKVESGSFSYVSANLLRWALQVPYVPEGLEAVVFTADGDMRQALNNLQATFSGFQFVNAENVFKVSK
jgi:hypothetical protein